MTFCTPLKLGKILKKYIFPGGGHFFEMSAGIYPSMGDLVL